ncbi:MAG: hypothetical protein TE42_02250 [Candidatus Synechococcus spongiarum SP3]|uniref:DUF1997 domain-containing protein n=1 Tax=Candidatus Synechococcus spongiarum SP3 TaxID=1604020 RepID=A0A0G2IWW4_9SYNE|nr:MAG: hypothetical protein TE42_02250 [Candidatus Synechococcus spongiarum SP3]
MKLAFSARQKLGLALPGSSEKGSSENLTAYLKQEERVVRVLLGSGALQVLGPAHYRYTLPRLKVFQLQVQPIVDLRTMLLPQRLVIRSCQCHLDSSTVLAVNDFQLQLDSWLEARGGQLEGEASLAVQVTRPRLLRLLPKTVLESTGVHVLAGVLGGIKARMSRKFLQDFQVWRREN